MRDYESSLPTWRLVVDGAASLAIIVVCLAAAKGLLWPPAQMSPLKPAPRQRPAGLPSEPISVEGAALKGNPEASVVVVEYSDFECPFCSSFAHTILPQLEKEYVTTGKVLFALRQLPLETIHRNARAAAEAAECADRQGKFWPMHDALFANPGKLEPVALRGYASQIGLDLRAYEACLTHAASRAVSEDVASATQFGVASTPTFLIGKRQPDGRVKLTSRFAGAAPFDRFRQELDKLLPARVGN